MNHKPDEEMENILAKEDLTDEEIDALLVKRFACKAKRDFDAADRIRNFLSLKNIEVRDGKNEAEWSRKSQ